MDKIVYLKTIIPQSYSMEKINIYEKYGGFDFFHKIIYELYLELFDHLEISYHFFGVDMLALSRKQAEFLCEAIGGPKMYTGGNIILVHKHMRITEYEFETVVMSFREIFKKNGLENDEINLIINFIRSKKSMIVTAKNTPMDRLMRFVYKCIKKTRRIAILIFRLTMREA